MPATSFENLFTPYQLKNLTLRNRFVVPPMQVGLARNFGPTDQLIDYLRRCAAGGAALIIGEAVAPDHPSSYWQPILCVLNLETAPMWAKAAAAVKREGARFLMQLWHPGAVRTVASGGRHEDYPSLSPSGLIRRGRPNGRAAHLQELDEIKAAYANAARLAMDLGADGVEIHSSSGHFLDQFLWNESNQRTDQYGGSSIVERARYPLEIVSAVRQAIGDDALIGYRFSQFKEVNYGARIAETPEELEALLAALLQAGVDCIHASGRRFIKPEWPERDPDLSLAGWVKRFTNAPVIAVGSVGLSTDTLSDLFDGLSPKLQVEVDLERASERLAAGEFDLLAVGRAHIANNNFVAMVRERRFAEMRPFNKRECLPQLFEQLDLGVIAESHEADRTPVTHGLQPEVVDAR